MRLNLPKMETKGQSAFRRPERRGRVRESSKGERKTRERENKPKRCSECGSGKSGGEGAAHAAGDLPSAFRRRTRRKLNSRRLTLFFPPRNTPAPGFFRRDCGGRFRRSAVSRNWQSPPDVSGPFPIATSPEGRRDRKGVLRTARRSVKRSRSDDLHFQRLRTHAWRLGSRPSAKQVLPSWLSDGALRRRRARPVGEPEFRPRTISFALPGKRGALSWSRGKEEEEGRVVVPLRVGVVLFVSLVANHAASAHLAAGPGDAHAFGRQPEKKNKTARYKVATWTASKAHTRQRGKRSAAGSGEEKGPAAAAAGAAHDPPTTFAAEGDALSRKGALSRIVRRGRRWPSRSPK